MKEWKIIIKIQKLQSNNDNNYKELYKRILTFNNKYINDEENKIVLFDKNTAENLKKLKCGKNEDVKKEIDNIIINIGKLQNSIRTSGSKTLKLSNKVEDNRINYSQSFEIKDEEED